ncbi:MAG: Rieske (2Fe-2S) protein [Deltaproteobacteria bacterium]|nr:Rieske (2Fe-2S) protein [Deltaproteobacteria bacterium]
MRFIIDFFRAIAGVCQTQPLAPENWTKDGDEVRVNIGAVEQLNQPDGAVYLIGQGLAKPILIVRAESGDLLAFQNACTHGGRKLDPVPGESRLRCCSLGHSTFDYKGARLSGSAKDPLTLYPVQEEEGRLVIQVG